MIYRHKKTFNILDIGIESIKVERKNNESLKMNYILIALALIGALLSPLVLLLEAILGVYYLILIIAEKYIVKKEFAKTTFLWTMNIPIVAFVIYFFWGTISAIVGS